MVHADACNLPSHISIEESPLQHKLEFYDQLSQSLIHLLEGSRNWVINLSNASSLLYHAFGQVVSGGQGRRGRNINWTGFYLLPRLFPSVNPRENSPRAMEESVKEAKLWLGPYQGKPACQYIPLPTSSHINNNASTNQPSSSISRPPSVCASAFLEKKFQLIHDVHQFPGHIACDDQTKSELVIPLTFHTHEGHASCVGVLDIDCTLLNGFDDEDVRGLEKFVQVLMEKTDWWDRV